MQVQIQSLYQKTLTICFCKKKTNIYKEKKIAIQIQRYFFFGSLNVNSGIYFKRIFVK